MLMHGLMMHCVAIASAKNSPAAAKGATELARKFKTLHEAVIKQFHTAKSNATVAKPFSNVTKTAKSLPLEAMLGAHHYNNFFTCTDPPVNYPGDGYCDAGNNVYPCFDGGDCCRISCEENCGDGSCTYSCGAHSGAGPDGYNCTDNRYLAPEHHYDPAMFTCPERPAANWPGDGYCDSSNNVAPCFDGGDCCPTSCAMNCDGSAGCHYTCGDGTTDACIDTRYDQPSQHYDTTLFFCPNPPTTNYPGDGFCDSSNNVAPCFDGGDCCLRTCEENCGIASSASPSTCFTLENTGFIGGDYSNAAASSVAECCATCAADTQCKLAVLVDGTCYLKDATAVLSQSQSGSTSIYPGPHPGYHCEYDCSVTTSGHECRDARYATVPAVYDTTLFTCPDPPAAVAPGDGFCNSANNVAPCFDGGDCCPKSCEAHCGVGWNNT